MSNKSAYSFHFAYSVSHWYSEQSRALPAASINHTYSDCNPPRAVAPAALAAALLTYQWTVSYCTLQAQRQHRVGAAGPAVQSAQAYRHEGSSLLQEGSTYYSSNPLVGLYGPQRPDLSFSARLFNQRRSI